MASPPFFFDPSQACLVLIEIGPDLAYSLPSVLAFISYLGPPVRFSHPRSLPCVFFALFFSGPSDLDLYSYIPTDLSKIGRSAPLCFFFFSAQRLG